MPKIKTSDLTGKALDWAVAKCEGFNPQRDDICEDFFLLDAEDVTHLREFSPSTNWTQGGPIIEREGIAVDCVRCDGNIVNWLAARPPMDDDLVEWDGPSLLIAAMRCYVASKLGDEVDVPNEIQ